MEQVEVAVVGASAAGLSAALTLARACRTVLVFDGGPPRNAASSSVHGFLSRDGCSPVSLLGTARAQLSRYPGVAVCDARVSGIVGDVDDGFLVEAPGGPVHAQRVLLATGMRDQLPPLPGFAALWGRDIFHCPYCHGWEVAGRRWGVVANDRPRVVRKLELLRNWTDDLVVFSGDGAGVHSENRFRISELAVERRSIVGLETDDAGLRGVTVEGGAEVPLRALLWPVRQTLPQLVRDLGLALDANGHVLVDEGQQTSRLGIFAAGDVSSFDHQQVTYAAASGVTAAKVVVDCLTRTRRLVVSMA